MKQEELFLSKHNILFEAIAEKHARRKQAKIVAVFAFSSVVLALLAGFLMRGYLLSDEGFIWFVLVFLSLQAAGLMLLTGKFKGRPRLPNPPQAAELDNTIKEAEKIAHAHLKKQITSSISPEDKKMVIGGWALFDEEVHNKGVSKLAKQVMKQVYNIDVKEGYKLQNKQAHADRVTKYSSAILKKLKLSEEEKQSLIESQELSLSDKQSTKRALRHQNEWWLGIGYPDGLMGTEIPFCSRITAVSETFDIMYDMWKDKEKAFNFINSLSKVRFEPALVEALGQACMSGLIP